MRLPRTAQAEQPWLIHDLTRDFRLEDVWALPTPGGPDGFPRLVRIVEHAGPSPSPVVRALFAIRWKIGELLGWDSDDSGAELPSIRDRVPAELGDPPDGSATSPFSPLYLTDTEFAAELANRTVHGVVHLGWVPDRSGGSDGSGGHRGQLAIYVKPNGRLGSAYLAAIKPFRHLIVYPAMLRQIERSWQDPDPV